MKSEKEIWLNPEEIKQLLEGGLYWKDIETKLSPADAEGFRRNLKKEDLSIEDIIWKPEIRQEEPKEESDQVRAILLGEEDYQQEKEGNQRSDSAKVIKDRQINLSYLQAEKELASVPHAAVEEVYEVDFKEDLDKDFKEVHEEDSEVKDDEMNAFSTMTNKHFDDKEFRTELENKGTPFGGLKLIVLLIVTAAITIGCWYYFISA